MVASPQQDDEIRGRDELNLAEFPIALLTNQPDPSVLTVTYQDRIMDKASGEWITRKVQIAGSENFGLPTAGDSDVIVALIQHTRMINNFTSRRVPFTRYELLKLMGWNDEGKNYNRIAESLRRWTHVTLTYNQAWRERAGKRWTSKVFHVIDEVEFNARSGRRKADIQDEVSWYTWSETVFDSIRQGNLKKLDLETYFSLNSAIAKRMFRYLDKHFYKTDCLKLDLDTFAFEKIGISRKNNVAQVKRKLQAAIEELEACGFIVPASPDQRYQQIERGEWKICFVRKKNGTTTEVRQQDPLPTNSVERRLIDYGVTESIAKDLVASYAQEEIDKQIKVMLWKQSKDPDSVPNPGGFLFKAITERWAIPQGYYDSLKKAEKQKAQVSAEDQKSRKKASERSNEERVRLFWKDMPEGDKEAFVKEAIEAADADTKELIQGMSPSQPLYRGHIAAVRDDLIRRKLGIAHK